MYPVRWTLLLLLGLLLGLPAAWAEVGTCYTSPLPVSDPSQPTCDPELTNCSTVDAPLAAPSPLPVGPRCLEPGPTCGSGDSQALSDGAWQAPTMPALAVVVPLRGVGTLPGAQCQPQTPRPVACDRAPPVPPPRG